MSASMSIRKRSSPKGGARNRAAICTLSRFCAPSPFQQHLGESAGRTRSEQTTYRAVELFGGRAAGAVSQVGGDWSKQARARAHQLREAGGAPVVVAVRPLRRLRVVVPARRCACGTVARRRTSSGARIGPPADGACSGWAGAQSASLLILAVRRGRRPVPSMQGAHTHAAHMANAGTPSLTSVTPSSRSRAPTRKFVYPAGRTRAHARQLHVSFSTT